MAAELGPGIWVECIEEDRHTNPEYAGLGRILVGEVHQISGIDPEPRDSGFCTLHGHGCSAPSLLFASAPLPDGFGWCAACFKPLGPGDHVSLAEFFRIKENA